MKIKSSGSGMRIYVLLPAILLTVMYSYSQNRTIILQDEQNKEALSDVYFRYGEVVGFSNQAGEISFDYDDRETLYLSHVAFGKLSVSPQKVASAIENGYLSIYKTNF